MINRLFKVGERGDRREGHRGLFLFWHFGRSQPLGTIRSRTGEWILSSDIAVFFFFLKSSPFPQTKIIPNMLSRSSSLVVAPKSGIIPSINEVDIWTDLIARTGLKPQPHNSSSISPVIHILIPVGPQGSFNTEKLRRTHINIGSWSKCFQALV